MDLSARTEASDGEAVILPAMPDVRAPWLRQCLEAAFPLAGSEQAPFAWRVAPSVTPPALERRSDERAKVAVYRSAMLRWGTYEGLCLIRDISAGGMMCRLGAPLTRGERVTVEMRSGHVLSGQVAWSRDGRTGIQFDERIDMADVLNAPVRRADGWVQRMPRLHLGCSASLMADGTREIVPLIDLSQGGAKVETDFLREGDEVILSIPGLGARRGTIRWTRDGRAGITFMGSIGFNLLAEWALERQSLGG